MNAEEELKNYKQETLKRTRITALVFGALAIICLVSLVYAFIQNASAVKAEKIAMVNVDICKEQLAAKEMELEVALQKVEQALIETNIAKATAEDCAKKSNEKPKK